MRILEVYDENCFEFFPNFIRVSFPYHLNEFALENQFDKMDSRLTVLQSSILSLMRDSPTITQEQLANLLNTTKRTIQRNIKCLIDYGVLLRTGSNRQGKWIVKD